MYKIYFVLLTTIALNYCKAQNTSPTVFIESASVNQTNKTVTINYNLVDIDNDKCQVWLKYTKDGNGIFDSVTNNTSGDIGINILPENSKTIIWSYPASISNINNVKFRLYASDGKTIDINELVNKVDSNLLKNNLNFIASGIRHLPTSTVFINKVRDTIETRFNDYKLLTEKQNFTINSYTGVNIIGTKLGLKNEASTFIIDAHYDGVSNGPAADDNGSGVVGMIEAARILSQYNFENSIKFIGFDFEESGLIGSAKYNQSGIKQTESIDGVLNFEMIGYYTNKINSQSTPTGFNLLFPEAYNALIADQFRGNFLVVCGNTNSNSLNSTFINTSKTYVPQLKNISIEVPQNGQIAPDFRRSDHASFWDNNKKALMLTDGADTRNLAYHTLGDSIGNLNFTFMSNIVKASIATIAVLAKPISISYAEYDISPINIFSTKNYNFPPIIQVFPNPTSDEFTLKINANEKLNIALSLIDVNGKTIYESTLITAIGANVFQIKPNHITKGTYSLLLKSNNFNTSKVITFK